MARSSQLEARSTLPGVPMNPPDPSVLCACFKLTASDLRRIIAARRCATVEDVAEATGACRGCQTCRPDIEDLLVEAAGRREEK